MQRACSATISCSVLAKTTPSRAKCVFFFRVFLPSRQNRVRRGVPHVPRPHTHTQLVVNRVVAVRETVLLTSFQGNEYRSKMEANFETVFHVPHTIETRPIIYNCWCVPVHRCYRYQFTPTLPVTGLLSESLSCSALEVVRTTWSPGLTLHA